MPVVPTRLLVINQQVQFSTRIKKTLEQVGGFDVASFTTAEAALDYLENRPQHVALVDYNLKGTSGVELILRLREIQPDLAVILTPKFPATEAAVRDFDLQGAVDTTISARELVTLLQRAVDQARDMLPDTVAAASVNEPETSLIAAEELPDSSDQSSPIAIEETSSFDDSPDGPSAFEQLAASEPPMPDLEHGTIHDLRNSVVETENDNSNTVSDTAVRQVVEILRDNEQIVPAEPLPPDTSEDDGQPILARQLLENIKDAPIDAILSTADGTVTSNTDRVLKMAVSAQEELELLINEPEPLPATPAAHTDEIEADSTAEPQQAVSASEPSDDLSDMARLALRLTQASLELATEATVLTQDNKVVAFAGTLAQEDIAELGALINDDWEAQADQSRIRFVTLTSSGKDYMLFSRRTITPEATNGTDQPNFTLTMVFAGNMPLRTIRRQSDRLLHALTEVPDTPAPEIDTAEEFSPLDQEAAAVPLPTSTPEVAEPLQAAEIATTAPEEPRAVTPYTGPTTPYTYIWMLRDSAQRLSPAQAQGVIAGLDRWLTERGWGIKALSVHDAYVYLFADVPGDLAAHDVIPELKRVSAQLIAQKDDSVASEDLWAEAYITLLPGRELNQDEIERFVRLGRLKQEQ